MQKHFLLKLAVACVFASAGIVFSDGSALDMVLVAYLGAAFLFSWSGAYVLGLGLVLGILSWVAKSQGRTELDAVVEYPFWLMGAGVVLLSLQRLKSARVFWMLHARPDQGFFKNAYYVTTKTRAPQYYWQWFGQYSAWVRSKIVTGVVTLPMLLLFTHWQFDSIMFVYIALILVLFAKDSRVPIIAAGLLFVVAAVAGMFPKRVVANSAIMYAYYCLWMVVPLEIQRWWRERYRHITPTV